MDLYYVDLPSKKCIEVLNVAEIQFKDSFLRFRRLGSKKFSKVHLCLLVKVFESVK